MSKRRGYKLTNAEAAKSQWNDPCPNSSCKSQKTYQVGTGLGYNGCHDCGQKWGWRDRRGQPISRRNYEELVKDERARWDARASRTRLLERGDSEMATKKKAKKKKAAKKTKTSAAKKKSKVKNAANRQTWSSATPKERSEKNAASYAVYTIATTKQTDAQITAAILKKFPDAAQRYKTGTATAVANVRRDMKASYPGYAWVKAIKKS